MVPGQFVAHWADTHLKETASYITHFDDLCELVGHPKPAHIDRKSTRLNSSHIQKSRMPSSA